MRLFGGKENEIAVAMDTTPRRSPKAIRKFGSVLSSNLNKTPDSNNNKNNKTATESSSGKKVVRVRRQPQSLTKESTPAALQAGQLSMSNENIIVFSPGPVGLQLEPINANPVYGCRVVRFVDDGPKNPGQARKSEKINPGDWVLKVQVEGTSMVATTFEEILNLLAHTHVKRVLTVKSMWDGFGSDRGQNSMDVKTASTIGFIPTRKATSFKAAAHSKRFIPGVKSLTHTVPPSVPEEDVLLSPLRSTGINNELVKSPSDMVLLSNSLDDLSRIYSSGSPQISTTDGPLILPKAISYKSLNDNIQKNDNLISKEVEELADGEDSITRSRSPSVFSENTAKSSNNSHFFEVAPQALADQFLLIDGYTGALVPESPNVSSHCDSADSRTATEDESIVEDDDEHPKTPVQELTFYPNEKHVSDSVKSQLQRQQELLDGSLLRADFEQRLQAARMEYSKTERELKKLYFKTCERNELKIRDLQSSNSTLRKNLNDLEVTNKKMQIESESRAMELDMSKTMVTELESRMLALETEKHEAALRFNRACDSIQELENCNQQKDKDIAARLSEVDSLRSQAIALKDELSRETDQRKEANDTAFDLDRQLRDKNEQIDTLKGRLGTFQSQLEESRVENQKLRCKLRIFEQEKAEALVLTEQLSQSVQEKQKAIVNGHSIVARLERENESLSKQIEYTSLDVENLLQDKLALEEKLANTWKNFQQARKDASVIHEMVLEKLENGEFYNATDMEEKQALVDALQVELVLVKKESFKEVMRQNRKAVNIHVKLHSLEHVLLDVQTAKNTACTERDEYRKAMAKIKEFVESARRHVEKSKEDFESVLGENVALKNRIESMQKNSEDVAAALQTRIELRFKEVEAQKIALKKLAKSSQESEQLFICTQTELQERLTSTNDELLATRRKLKEVSQQRDDIASSKVDLHRKLSEVETHRDVMEKECQQKLNEIDALKGKVASAERALSNFSEMLSKAKASEDSISQKYDAMVSSKVSVENFFRGKLAAMEDELRTWRGLAARRESDFESAKATTEKNVGDLKHLIKTLTIELQEKEGQLSLAQSTISQLENEKRGGQSSQAMLEEELVTLKHKMKQVSLSYKEQIDTLHVSAKLKIDELQEEMTQIKADFKASAESWISSKEQLSEQHRGDVEKLRKENVFKIEEFERNRDFWMAKEQDLLAEIEMLRLENNEASESYCKDIESLTQALSVAERDNVDTKMQLKEVESIGSCTRKKLREQLESVVKDAEESATTYWEDLQGLTAELQCKDELLSCAESRTKNLESEIRVLQQQFTDVKNELVDANAQVMELQADVASHAQLLDCSEGHRANLDATNSELRSKIAYLEDVISDKSARQVKVLARLNSLEDEKEKCETQLRDASSLAKQLQEEAEKQRFRTQAGEALLLELEEKTKQLQNQTDTVSRLQGETRSLMSFVKNLENEVETLETSLRVEKEARERNCADAADAKMDLIIQANKLGYEITCKEQALCKSENCRSKLARSLLQANAVITSLKIQLKEKDQTNVMNQNCDLKVNRLQLLYDQAIDEGKQARERSLLLEAALQERNREFILKMTNLEELKREVVHSREQLVLKEKEVTSLSRSLEAATTESSHLKNIAAEAQLLHQEIEVKSNQIVAMETTLSRAEQFAEAAFHSLELAQQSEDGLREKFSGLKSCLRKEVLRLKEAHGSPVKMKGDKSSVSENSFRRYCKPTLEYELNSISDEMVSLSAFIDKRRTDVDALHKTVTDLATKLAETEVESAQQKEELLISRSSHEAQLHSLEADHQAHILVLQKLVLATRASCIAIQFRKRHLQKTVAVEKADLLQNIESLSARLLSMQDFQKATIEEHENTVLSLQKNVLKLRADYIVEHVHSQKLESDLSALETEHVFTKAALRKTTADVMSMKLELKTKQAEIEKFLVSGLAFGEWVRNLNNQSDDMRSILRRLNMDMKEKNQSMTNMASAIKRLEHLREDLIGANSSLQAELIVKNSIVVQLKEDLASISDDLKTERERNNKLAKDRASTNAINIALRDAIKSLRTSLSTVKVQISHSDQHNDILENLMHLQTLSNQKLEHKLKVSKASMEMLQWRHEQHCAKAERVIAEKLTTDECHRNLQLDVAQMRQRIVDLRRDRDVVQDRVARESTTTQVTLEQRESQIAFLLSEIQAKDQSIIDLKERLTSFDREQNGVVIALAMFSKSLEVGRSSISNLNLLKDDLEQQLKTRINEYLQLQKSLEERKSEYALLKAERENLEAGYLSQIACLEQKVASLQQKLQDTATKYSSTNAIVVDLRDEVNFLRTSLSTAEEQVCQSNRRVNVLEGRLSSKTVKNQKLELNLKVNKASMDMLQWKIEQCCTKAERVEAEKLKTEESRINLQLDVAQMHHIILDLQRDRETIRESAARESTAMQLTLEQQESQIVDLQSEIEAKDQSMMGLEDRLTSFDREQKGVIIALAIFNESVQLGRSSISNLKLLKDDLEQQLKKRNNQYSQLYGAFEKSRSERTFLEAEKKNLETVYSGQIVCLEQKVSSLQQKLQETETEALKLIRELQKLQDLNQCLQVRNETLESYRRKTKKFEEESERLVLQAKQQEKHIVDMEESIVELNGKYVEKNNTIAEMALHIEAMEKTIMERDSKTTELTRTVESLTESFRQISRNQDEEGLSEEMSSHVIAVKEAFRKQTEVLGDLQLSENVLSSFMNEVLSLASRAETEALQLSSTLNSVEDLLIRPSSCLASLDLAGIGAANEYVEEVRNRLEQMAALAYNTSIELMARQNEFHRWRSSRPAPPSIPITPPAKTLSACIPTTCGFSNDLLCKMAGARLLNCVIENRSKMELACAFRKWSCSAGAISASCGHKETVVALAQQLDQTRDKLLLLKSHLKGKQQKPRLRRILARLDSNVNNDDTSFEI